MVLKAFQQLLHKKHLKTPKITKFHMPLYYHKNAFDVTKVAKVSD